MSDHEKDLARAKRIEDKMHALLAERGHDRPRLAEYIEACSQEGIIDHAIRALTANSFYIHPHGASGPPLDFFLAADGQVLGRVDQSRKGSC